MTANYPQAELIESFDQLTASLAQLAAQLRNNTAQLWIPLTDTELASGIAPIDKAIQLYCDLWHQQGQDGRRTESRHGLIAADDVILTAAQQVNHSKQRFQAAVAALRQTPKDAWFPDINRRDSQLREDLNRKGLGRLHLKQCYRRIPLCRTHPKRAGFNWYNSGRSIQRVSIADVEQQLIRMDSDKPHIRVQLEQLGQLRPGTPLARVQQQAPLMRVNLAFDGGQEADTRQAMNLSLPLLFRQDPARPFPEHNSPALVAPTERQRSRRSDCLIDETPFLPSLRIHRYLETHS